MYPPKSRFELPFWCLRAFSIGVLKTFFALEVRGLEHVERIQAPVILAGNHTGFLDGGMILAACRQRFRFLMTEEVLGWGLIGKIVRHANIIVLPKANEKRTLVQVIQALRQGERICIFPEGKLTQDGEFNEFHEGVAFLHQKSGTPIIPFAISGGFEAWPQWRSVPRFRKVILQFGEPLSFGVDVDRATITHILLEKVTEMKSRLDYPTQTLPIPKKFNGINPVSVRPNVLR